MAPTNTDLHARCRELGQARVALLENPPEGAKQPDPEFPYAFEWGTCWKHCVEYSVDDFAAELGFFVDLLGFRLYATGKGYAMLASPDGEMTFSFVASSPERPATPPGALRLQLMLADAEGSARALEERGVAFEKPVGVYACDGVVYEQMRKGTFRAPSGVAIDVWGFLGP